MPEDTNDPVDRARTFRPHAGESLKDRAAWPGLLLVAFGIIAVVLGLAAAAYQFYGWTIVLGVAALLCFASGWLWLHLERQRIRQLDSAEHQ